MIEHTKTIDDPSGHVSKLIFEDDSEAIAETVAYKYEDRGVVCFSVQSGCRVGCAFCGTGKKFIRNLTTQEMHLQIDTTLKIIGDRDKIQIMSMSMGEPTDNWWPVYQTAKHYLLKGYYFFISTVGLENDKLENRTCYWDMCQLGHRYKKFGIQFSIHCTSEKQRQKIIGVHNHLLSFKTMKMFTKEWATISGNKVYFNYICIGQETKDDAKELCDLAEGQHITCSVLCNTGDFIKADKEPANRFMQMILADGRCDVSTFDPAGQDTIGGGCGQLLYVQQKLKEQR